MRHFFQIPPSARRFQKGFTLLELLTVMAIMGLMLAVTVPAVKNVFGARSVSQAVYEISGILEFARSEAVTRQTYVWVGFQNVDASGARELQMTVVASRDGSGTNVAAANMMGLSRVTRLRNLSLSKWSDLKEATRNQASVSASPSSVSANTNGISFDVGVNHFNTKSTITFTPRGEALLNGAVGPNDGYDPLIDISFRQSHGVLVKPDADDASILVDGATGMIRSIKL